MRRLFTVKLVFSLTLYAGFFGIFNIFNTAPEPTLIQNTYNTQTLPLLEAVPTPKGVAVGGAEIIIVDDSALYPETGNGSSVSLTPSEFAKHSDKISTYVVQEGDTISQIAEMFQVSTNTIRWGNDIDAGGVIQPGQRLIILPINGVRHTVLKGETVRSVAKTYKGDVDEILRYNELARGTELAIGQIVVIPGGDAHVAVVPKKTSSGTYLKATVTTSGYYINPVPGAVLTQGLHPNNAIDLAAPTGTPIIASAAGEVIISKQSGWNGGYANYIVIKHANGTQTLYAHNSSNAVYVGQYVEQGQMIGYVGATGNATGPHVHFEVRGGINPMAR